MEDEKIEEVRNWLESKSVQDIQVFIGFANLYWQFIWGFGKIAAPLILILNMTGSSDLTPKELEADNNEVVRGGSKVDNRNLS